MAPETYEDGYNATANVFTVDIFSLGATLFEAANLKKAIRRNRQSEETGEKRLWSRQIYQRKLWSDLHDQRIGRLIHQWRENDFE